MIVFNKRKFKKLPLRIIHLEGANFFLVLLVGVLLSLSSCDKSSVIGLKVQPANDLLNVAYIDTTTLFTKTVRADSLRTDQILIFTAEALLGKYRDPVFGASTASIYTQLGLTTNAPVFGASPLIDSVVLALVYDPACYGKTIRLEQKVNVYYVSEDISNTIYHYSNNSLSVLPFDLANNHQFIPKPADSIHIGDMALKPQLRIPLDKSLGQSILENPGNLVNNLAFQSLLKGLYITTENTTGLGVGEGNILHFRLADAQSKLTLFYHSNAVDSTHFNQKKYDLSLNSVARFSHFSHDYSAVDANLAAQLSTNPPQQNDVVFIQAMAGVKTKIELPYIMNWVKSGPIAVNKAELVIKVDLSSAYQLDTFAAPAQLVLFGINDDGTEYVLPDYSEGSIYFGGIYNSTTHEYRFNIARYIQQVLTGKRNNNGLHLLASSGSLNANRVVIGGGGAGSLYRMKLNIAYTKLH